MKLAIITDQHFGVRNDSQHFLDFYEKFYSGIFFPTLVDRKITDLLILGDTFDRRKFVNFFTLQQAKKMFFDRLQQMNIKVHMLIGNHDTFYKNTNDVNSPELLLEDYDNITKISKPQDIEIDGTQICMMPWICTDNFEVSMEHLEATKAKICMGHLGIEGFQMYKGAPAEEGMQPGLFKKFDMVFSGHFHHKSTRNNIYYLGNPYQLTWQDYGDVRGFHIWDTDDYSLEFIENTFTIFHKVVYDDKNETAAQISTKKLDQYKNTYVKVLVVNKTNPYVFDLFLNNLENVNPIDVITVEDIVETSEEDDVVDEAEDTITIVNKVVDNMTTELDKTRLKSMLREIYVEALSGES